VSQPGVSLSAKQLLLAVALLCAAVVLTACGGGKSAATGTIGSEAPSRGQSGQGNGQGNGQRQFPGASGELAAISGNTLQVQSTTAQTAVTYTSATKITDVVAATVADVKVGVCVQARPVVNAPASGDGGDAAGSGAPTGPITAMSVEISSPVNGECGVGAAFPGAGGGGFGAGVGGGLGDARPSGSRSFDGSPRPRPSGSADGTRRGGVFGRVGANGQVTSVSANGFVVKVTRFAGNRAGSDPSAASPSAPSASPSRTSQLITVTTTSATTYTRNGPATASAFKVGLCVTALGKADDTGAIAATSIALRPKGNSASCGFGGPNG